MADNIGNKLAKDYNVDIPYSQESFYVKGMNDIDWGVLNDDMSHKIIGVNIEDAILPVLQE
ncbi:hypothetical protein SH2C18_19080 [Clostridium sediminicola]|uniref:hypothetical protein n=1 Tax=Clostridium sediminicola TaxID=3114879 RepID=UPI0031F1E9CF